MNHKNPKTTKSFPKVVKNLTVCAVLSLSFLTIFYPNKTSSQSLGDCSSFVETITNLARPGDNCLFVANKLLCKIIPAANYSIPTNNFLSSGQVHRVNCYDLSDMPLCTQLDEIQTDPKNIKPGKNCAKECSTIEPTADASASDRGKTYAVHNRDCVRFCDSVGSENTARGSSIESTEGVTCISRKCNQLDAATTPTKDNNCSQLPCNLLSVNELIVVIKRMNERPSSTQAYCNGEKDINDRTLKCYKFSEEQLPYTIASKMCVIHNCKPSADCYDSYVASTDVNGDGIIQNSAHSVDSDDSLNIKNKGASYVATYKDKINNKAEVISSSYCNAVTCKPIVKQQFRCATSPNSTTVSGDSNLDIYRNSQCDTSGEGAGATSCATSNLCYKTIDCNQAANASLSECRVYEDPPDRCGEDPNDSCFYRPKPMKKAMGNNNFLREQMSLSKSGKLCYSKGNLEGNSNSPKVSDWGGRASKIFDLGLLKFEIDLGYFLTYLTPNTTKSPGLCDGPRAGSRGNGYLYLCGNKGLLYEKPSDYTAFHLGYVKTTFQQTADNADDASHKLIVCLRFKNAMRPDDIMNDSETCGSRECGINCAFDSCYSQVCGYEVCKELTVTELDPKNCEMKTEIFDGSLGKKIENKPCMAVIDDYLRLRVQKYGNKICSYLDVKGQTAYPSAKDLFARGNEVLEDEDEEDDKTCVSGNYSKIDTDKYGCKSGKDTTDNPSSAERWRTIKFGNHVHIPYIQNNQAGSDNVGYFDKNGQFFAEQDCIKTKLRLPPPNLNNLANNKNSPKLFNPPIFIRHAFTRKDSGIISQPVGNESFGYTDFNYPEIEVSFGDTTEKLGLEINYNGYETDATTTEIETELNSIKYSAKIFVRKEFNASDSTPTLCLYKEVTDIEGIKLYPQIIGCVKRNFPVIKSISLGEKLKIYAEGSNTFKSAKINLKYVSFGTNGTDDDCGGDDSCSSEISLENIDVSKPTCNENSSNNFVEGYKICAQREECTKLNIECIQNEIDMQTATLAGNSTDSFMVVRNICNQTLLPRCNNKMGASTSSSDLNILDDITTRTGNAYGWFNEICFVEGNDTKSFSPNLKKVVAYKLDSGIAGKCLIDIAKSANGGAGCNEGGKAPDCICVEYYEGVDLDADKIERIQTPHEAGLCIDIPLPQTCPAIKYTTTLSSDPGDLYYAESSITSSLLKAGDIHQSHKDRAAGTSSGHAEFPKSVFGMNLVQGDCKGFWENRKNENALSLKPTRNCLNRNGTAVWDTAISNICVRYSCEAISAASADPNGVYLDGYGKGYEDDARGSVDGYATWARYTKTNDDPEDRSAVACIVGYKQTASVASITKGVITSYTGGTPPNRFCDQLGNWKSPNNSCVRIMCPAVNPPASPDTSSNAWAQWYNSGGATFKEIKSSISSYAITPGSEQTGTCNEELGFHQTEEGKPPTRYCDHLGNWSEVYNKCTTECAAIPGTKNNNTSTGADENNGFASWATTTAEFGVESLAVTSSGCLSGYLPYPYPPLKNSDGAPYTLSDDSTSSETIPLTVANDTRLPDTLPQRKCKSVTSTGGVTADYWYPASSSCINKCPGSGSDRRIGVGKTKHNIKNAGSNDSIIVDWPDVPFSSFDTGESGKWIYASGGHVQSGNSIDNLSQYLTGQEAPEYSSKRPNTYYLLARKCNSNGKWDDPIPQCATGGGEIGESHAVYSSESRTGSKSLDVGSDATTSTCALDGYKNPLDISSYTCQYKDPQQNINETYFHQKEGGSPCQIYCSVDQDQEFGRGSKYTGSNNDFIPVNGEISLSCRSNFGHAFGSGSDSTCGGRISTDRISAGPSPIKCQTDGTWESNVTNDCAACRNCSASGYDYIYHDNGQSTNYTGLSCYCDEDGSGNSEENDHCYSINVSLTRRDHDGYNTSGNYYRCGNGNDDFHNILFDNCNSGQTCSKTLSLSGGNDRCRGVKAIYKCNDGKYKLESNCSLDGVSGGGNGYSGGNWIYNTN